MNYFSYITALLPTFEKQRMMRDVDDIRQQLVESTLPPYKTAAETLDKNWNWKSKEVERFDRNFQRDIKSEFKGNFIQVTYKTLARMADNLDTLEQLIDNSFQDTVVGRALSYQQAGMLRYLEMMNFTLRYSNLLLRWTLANENATLGDTREDSILKGEVAYLQEWERDFIDSLRILGSTERDLKTKMDNIPQVEITEENEKTVAATMGMQRINPFRMGLISKDWNPIYYLRMGIADWRVNRFKAQKEERRVLQYQLMRMKELREEGEANPALDKEIEATTNNLNRLNNSIKKMEDKYGR